MALKICEHCDKAYIDSGNGSLVALCQLCDEELKGVYRLVWNYLRDSTADGRRHRKISPARLADELGIKLKAIDILIRMGKIQIDSSDDTGENENMAGKKLEILRRIGTGIGRDPKNSGKR